MIEKAKLSCFNSGHRIEDHFVDVTEMIEIGKGGQRPVKAVLLSRYACYLVIQNADPGKEIVAQGQTYFAIQTRRQEMADERIEDERRVLLINGKDAANRTHREVGTKVRQTIRELGGTMPEALPVLESIKKIETQQRKQIGKIKTPVKKKGE